MIRIHVDQGRRGTNLGSGTDYPILRVDNEAGEELAKAHAITLICGCGCGHRVATFVQPTPDTAHVVVAAGDARLLLDGDWELLP